MKSGRCVILEKVMFREERSKTNMYAKLTESKVARTCPYVALKKLGVTVRIAEKAPLLKGRRTKAFEVVASAKMLKGGNCRSSTSMAFYLSIIY